MANGVTREKIQLDIEVGGNKARKQLNDLKDESRELRKEQEALRTEKRKLNKEDENYRKEVRRVNKELRANRQALEENRKKQSALREQIGMTALTSRELRNELRHLKQVQSNMVPGTDKWNAYQKKIEAVEQRMFMLRTGASKMGLAIKNLASTVNHYAGMFMALGFAVYGAYNLFIKGNKELSDQLADVQKRTEMTRAEILALYGSLLRLDTRTSREELLQLAEVAGRLGIRGRQNILQFVSAADQLKVSVGEDLAENAEDGIREIGKLVNIFKLDQQFGLEKSMLKIGSAINELGQNSTAQEKYIVDFVKRVAGIAPQADISITKVMGLAASLDILGQSAEVSSTVYAQVIPGMFKDTETYASIAGMSMKEFSKLLKTDANEAFLRLLQGLNGNNDGMQKLAERLDQLGLDGKRVTTVLGALAGNVELVREQQALANREFDKGTSITNEFNRKNQNLAGNLDKIGKILKEVFVSGSLIDGLTRVTNKILDWMRIPTAKIMEEERTQANLLYMELQDANTTENRRLQILKELETINPSIVSGIDSEAISMDKLRQNLQAYNEEMAKRILLENLKAEEKEQLTNEAEALGKMMQNKQDFDALVLEMDQELALSDKTREEKYNIIKDRLQDIVVANQKANGQFTYSEEAASLARLNDVWINLGKNTKAYNEASAESLDFSKRFAAIKKELGLEDGPFQSSGMNNEPTDPQSDPAVEYEIDVEALRIEALEAGKEAEIALENKRHADKLKKYKTNAKALLYENLIHKKKMNDINKKYLDKQLADDTINYQLRMGALEEAFQNEEITEQQYNERKRKLMDDYNADVLRYRKAYQSLSNEELMNEEIEAARQRGEALKLTEEEIQQAILSIRKKYAKKQTKEMAANLQEEVNLIIQGMDPQQQAWMRKAQGFMSVTEELGNATENMFVKMIEGQEAYAQNFLLIALDMIQKYINLLLAKMLAESMAQADSVATFGATGAARYVVLSAAVNTAFGFAKAAINADWSKRKQRRGGGYYDVLGEEDGRSYRAEALSNASTGFLPSHPVLMPSGVLASEIGREYYVDTNSLVSSMRDQLGLTIADHVRMIEAMKHSYTQMASGGYYPSSPQREAYPSTDPELKQMLAAVYGLFSRLEQKGIKATVNKYGTNGLEEALTDIDEFKSKVFKQ